MLRIWGGGLYEPDVFYQACDEKGIMLMHDFMYSCSYYPDHEDWFLHEAKKEADYQARRLANHACMAIWTGNNEIAESFTDWFPEEQNLPYLPGEKIFNYIQPRAVQDNCPEIPYKPSSPYGGNVANSQDEGDSHVWKHMARFARELPGKANTIFDFDRLHTRLSSEYGFHGPMMESSMRRCLDLPKEEPLRFGHPDWIHHGKPRPSVDRIMTSITRHFVDADGLDEQGYLLYGGVNQGMLYREMTDALRKKDFCYGNLIWMYNDCWPDNGWTTVDYYLTRKISFYFVKRAFATRKLLMRMEGDQAVVIFHNESPVPVSVEAQYGYAAFDEVHLSGANTHIIAGAHERKEVFSFPVSGDLKKVFAFVRPTENAGIDPVTSVRGDYRTYGFVKPTITVTEEKQDGKDALITLRSSVYAPVVYIAAEDDRAHFSDNYFEMLPDCPVTIRAEAAKIQKYAVKALGVDTLLGE
jgi:beta-mannosidase